MFSTMKRPNYTPESSITSIGPEPSTTLTDGDGNGKATDEAVAKSTAITDMDVNTDVDGDVDGHEPTNTNTVAATTDTEINNNNKFKCFYCNNFYLNDNKRVDHIDNEHQGKLHYPTPEDFMNRLTR